MYFQVFVRPCAWVTVIIRPVFVSVSEDGEALIVVCRQLRVTTRPVGEEMEDVLTEIAYVRPDMRGQIVK